VKTNELVSPPQRSKGQIESRGLYPCGYENTVGVLWIITYIVWFRCFGRIFHVILLAITSLYTKHYYSGHCVFIASTVGYVMDKLALRLVSVQVIWFSPVRNIPKAPHKYSFFYHRGYTRIILPTNRVVSFMFENLCAKIWCVMDLLLKSLYVSYSIPSKQMLLIFLLI